MTLIDLLKRSSVLEQELLMYFDYDKVKNAMRDKTTLTMCNITFEHARSLRVLMKEEHYTSAIGMERLQYESLVRAVWIFYAASEKLISNFNNGLTVENEKSDNKLPMLSEMINEIEKHAPKRAHEMLMEIKNQSWKPMNSYIHSGIHPVNRIKEGYPLPFLFQAVKHSNNMLTLAAILLAILTNNNKIAYTLDKIQHTFKDCLILQQ